MPPIAKHEFFSDGNPPESLQLSGDEGDGGRGEGEGVPSYLRIAKSQQEYKGDIA